jgi:beta-glucosidase
MAELRFPPGFMFGAAVGAYQVEGGNTNTDWWWWEHREGTPCVEPSGDACDFYHRYAADIAMVADLRLDAFRFGVEWARVEPAPGEFSVAALQHYRRMLACCREHMVVPILTFHHFTLPMWVHEAGGFASPQFPRLFERYCTTVASTLGDLIGYACTINEPQGLGLSGYVIGVNPPGRVGDHEGARRAADHLLEAHRLAARAIKQHSGAPVGVTLAIPDLQYEDGAQPGDSGFEVESRINDEFFEVARSDDFIGVQTYTRVRFGPEGPHSPGSGWSEVSRELLETDSTTQMGYEFYPRALGGAIRRAWKAAGGIPILVTENGVATLRDERRIDYMKTALGEVVDCLDEAIEVRGYIHWSLLDNFEWIFGYKPRFGLVEVDRETLARRPKPSAHWLGEVARASRPGTGGAAPPRRPTGAPSAAAR